MDIVTDGSAPNENIAPWGGGPRCTAKSKRSQVQCKNAAMSGVTKCRMHGGKTEARPMEHSLTHGQYSPWVHQDKIKSVLSRARALDTPEGRAEAVKIGHALTTVRLEQVPEGEQFHDVYFRGANTALKHVETLHGLEAEEQAPQLPTFVLNVGDATQQAPFEARTLEGHCTVRMLDGKPFLLDAATGGWMPAQLRKDEDSGAEFYERVLALNAPEG
jgi:hypothetical protein